MRQHREQEAGLLGARHFAANHPWREKIGTVINVDNRGTSGPSLIYETGTIRAMVRVDNLLDKTYAASGFISRTGHFPGEPRSAFLEIGYRF